jgi:hypothetical protein
LESGVTYAHPPSFEDQFQSTGVAVLRRFFNPGPLTEEVHAALAAGLTPGHSPHVGVATSFRYVPMMCEATPGSLRLLDELSETAAVLLGRPVIPTRAKVTRYLGHTKWHADSDLPVASLGFAAYLEPLTGADGALRVVAGSHKWRDPDAIPPAAGAPAAGSPVASRPGDIIAFDEHLRHASTTPGVRRQWRVDFVVDPGDAQEEALLRAYFARIFPRGWDGGYDASRYPSYGAHWQASGRPWVDRMRNLGVYRLAADQ